MLVIWIVLASFLTGLGVFDDIVDKFKMGVIIPITGFSNSIVAPAIEFKSEGYILGIGANMFKVAGPVLVYGTTTAVILGFIYYIFNYIK